jgi:hypothetical protein
LVVTYIVESPEVDPVTNVLIKGFGPIKHAPLKEENKVGLSALVPSKATQHE